MPRQPNETALEYKKRMIDSVSPSFCAAKWLHATIWLSSGQTASCHHPPPHRIKAAELQNNPSAIHNTEHKKLMRAQMLKGERPKECEYCWKIEDMNRDAVSDRVHKTEMFSDADVKKAQALKWDENAPLKHLEIAFDRRCNFACSYCNPGYSTKWAQDIDKFGAYQNLQSDGAGAYWHNGTWSDKFDNAEANPYVEAFWKWWPDLNQSLDELRITGGEPMMSPHFWKFLDIIQEKSMRDGLLFTVNSNLGLPETAIQKFIEKTKNIKNLWIYTSCEATGKVAEYIRDGMNFEAYCKNVELLLDSKQLERLQVMVTVNSLALYGLTEFLDQMMEWKKKYGKMNPAYGLTILRFPSFMSPSTLPFELRQERAAHIRAWLDKYKDSELMMPHEYDTASRLIDYLEIVEDPHHKTSDAAKRRSDFKMFYKQYDKRRGKSFEQTFPKALVDFYNSIPEVDLKTTQKLISGDASEGYHQESELADIRKKYNLVDGK